ncbi:MAG: CBS domain-containing protein [Gammaproteobacteria bacterium]
MLAKIAASDYMSTKLISVTPDTDVLHAIKKLLDHKVTSVPVIDERGKLVGVFSEIDGMKMVVETAYNQSMSGKVSEFMTKDPIIVSVETNLVDVAAKFQQTEVRSFPVFHEGELAGMISRIDVLRALIAIGG